MGKVSTGFSMSLDGFVAGPQDDVSRLSQWMTSGDIDITVSTGDRDRELKVPSESADMFQGANKQIGALVAGRRLFDLTGGYGGQTSPGRTSAIEPRQNGSRKDGRSPSSPTAWKAPLNKQKRLQATNMLW